MTAVATNPWDRIRELERENERLRAEVVRLTGGTRRPLTPKQRRVFDFLKQHIDRTGAGPSFETIAKAMGFQSLSTVHGYLVTLERLGWIHREPKVAYAITILAAPSPLTQDQVPA